jgi:hypothetical protein
MRDMQYSAQLPSSSLVFAQVTTVESDHRGPWFRSPPNLSIYHQSLRSYAGRYFPSHHKFMPESRFSPRLSRPDAAPSWAFRDLWLAPARSHTGLARVRISGYL